MCEPPTWRGVRGQFPSWTRGVRVTTKEENTELSKKQFLVGYFFTKPPRGGNKSILIISSSLSCLTPKYDRKYDHFYINQFA